MYRGFTPVPPCEKFFKSRFGIEHIEILNPNRDLKHSNNFNNLLCPFKGVRGVKPLWGVKPLCPSSTLLNCQDDTAHYSPNLSQTHHYSFGMINRYKLLLPHQILEQTLDLIELLVSFYCVS